MAEQTGDKTEAPTPRRRIEAREQGNIARSADLSGTCLLLGMLVMLDWYGGGVVQAMRSIMDRMLGPASMNDLSPGNAALSLAGALVHAGTALAPLFAGGVLIVVAVNMAQVGLHFNVAKLQPNLGALNPLKGAGRMFKAQSWVQLAFNLGKLTVVSWVAYSAVADRIGEIAMAQGLELIQIFHLGASLVYAIGMRLAVFLLVLALLDYAYQRFRVENELKMTKQEIRDEMKKMEGDPQIKQRRRQIGQQMAVQKLRQDVPTADVVVTNPTHYAVALRYDKENMHAPRVVAKGQDFLALRIREIAAASGVPILERPPLARSLYATVEVGREIPEDLYAAVAEILAYVYELTGKARRAPGAAAAGGRRRPEAAGAR